MELRPEDDLLDLISRIRTACAPENVSSEISIWEKDLNRKLFDATESGDPLTCLFDVLIVIIEFAEVMSKSTGLAYRITEEGLVGDLGEYLKDIIVLTRRQNITAPTLEQALEEVKKRELKRSILQRKNLPLRKKSLSTDDLRNAERLFKTRKEQADFLGIGVRHLHRLLKDSP